MSFDSNSQQQQQQQQRRQRRGRPPPPLLGTVTTVATTAAVAYGVYRAYDYFVRTPPKNKEEEAQNEAGDVTAASSPLVGLLTSLLLGGAGGAGDERESSSQRASSTGIEKNERVGSSSPFSTTTIMLDPRTHHRLAKQFVQNCRREAVKAFAMCWPAIQEAIHTSTDTGGLTKELKELRKMGVAAAAVVATTATTTNDNSNDDEEEEATSTTNNNNNTNNKPNNKNDDTDDSDCRRRRRQDELWQEIQVETFTRYVATIYAYSLVFLSMTMQLHWVGGQVFREGQQRDEPSAEEVGEVASNNSAEITRTLAHRVMLQTHAYILHSGVPMLISATRRAVGIATEDWEPTTTFLTANDLDRMFGLVDKYLDRGYPPTRKHSRNWIRILFPDADADGSSTIPNNNENDEKMFTMLGSFWDLAESPIWQDAQFQALATTKQYLRDNKNGWGDAFVTIRSEEDAKSRKETKEPISVPLARLMAPIKNSCSLLSNHSADCQLLKKIQRLPTSLELGDTSFQE